MKSNKIHVQPSNPAESKKIASILPAGDEEAPADHACNLLSTQPDLKYAVKAASVSTEELPFKPSEWESSRMEVLGLRVPFLDALLLFFSMLSAILSYFKYLALSIGPQDISPAAVLALYVISIVTIYVLIRNGWDNIGKRCLFYKLLERKVLINFQTRSWYKSPTIGLLILWGIYGAAMGFHYRQSTSETPAFVLLAAITIALQYKVIVDMRRILIPLGVVLTQDTITREEVLARKQWVQGIVVVPQSLFYAYIKTFLKLELLNERHRKEKKRLMKSSMSRAEYKTAIKAMKRKPYWDDIAADLLRSESVEPDAYSFGDKPLPEPLTLQERFEMYSKRTCGVCLALIEDSCDTGTWTDLILLFTFSVSVAVTLYGFFMFVSKVTPLGP